MKVYIEGPTPANKQWCHLGHQHWTIARLIELTRDFQVLEIPLFHLNIYHKFKAMTLRDMVTHIKTVQAADLSFPIILDEDGEILDGRHRIMKALLEGHEIIKAVRFDTNPIPCKIQEEGVEWN